MGNIGELGVSEAIARSNYDYGHQMAEKGYVTYAIDWMGAGSAMIGGSLTFFPPLVIGIGALYYLHATMLGTTPLAINLSHGRAATDFICSLPLSIQACLVSWDSVAAALCRYGQHSPMNGFAPLRSSVTAIFGHCLAFGISIIVARRLLRDYSDS